MLQRVCDCCGQAIDPHNCYRITIEKVDLLWREVGYQGKADLCKECLDKIFSKK